MVMKRMPSFSCTSGSGLGVSCVLPLQPNQTPPSPARSAASTPTANPPADELSPGIMSRFDTTISRATVPLPCSASAIDPHWQDECACGEDTREHAATHREPGCEPLIGQETARLAAAGGRRVEFDMRHGLRRLQPISHPLGFGVGS